MVIAKPIELTMVRAVPRDSPSALFATRVENRGESATTTAPQRRRNIMRSTAELWKNMRGESRQQIALIARAVAAVFLVPRFREIYPPATQATPPIAMIKKESKGTLNRVPGWRRV